MRKDILIEIKIKISNETIRIEEANKRIEEEKGRMKKL